jgi:hypothetical protein
VHDGDDVDAVIQLFEDEPVGKPWDLTGSRWSIKESKPSGFFLNLSKDEVHCVEELSSQVLPLALVIPCCGNKFDISFTMVSDRLHETARRAFRMTSAAGTSFDRPSRSSRRRRRISVFQACSAFESGLSFSKLTSRRWAISARASRGRLNTSMQIFNAVVLMVSSFRR